MRIHHLFYAAILGLTIATPSAAQTAATTVTGTWKASFVTQDRTYPAGLELKQDGEKLTGNLLSDTKDPIVGSVEGQNVSFTFQTPNPGGDGSILSIGVKCTLDKDALSGEFTVNDGPGGTFSAQRATPAPKSGGDDVVTQAGGKVDLTGNWALSVDFGTISATPSAVFKQDGDTLTGQYTSQQYGTFPLKGTLKGNQLSFTFTMTIEGNAIDALFSGTADKDTMKGSVNYGGIGEGTFTGTRKK
jgi:hypothetical protein